MDYVVLRSYVMMTVLSLQTYYCQYLSNDINGGKGPRVVSLNIRSDIVYRFAETIVTSTVVNELYDARETTFDVSLPEAAFISNFTLEIDGIEYPGVVKEKGAAKKSYEKAKRKGQSAGHIVAKPRDTNKFRVNINIAAQSEISFILTYDELLQRKRGQYEHTIYIDPKQIVDQLLVEVFIYESREITALRIPPVRNDILSNSFEISTSNELATVERPSSKTAYIRYNPSPEEQKMSSAQGITGLFKVQYDVQRSLDAGDVYVVNGYFTHFFAPVGLQPLRKKIMFVLDVSGSMSFSRKLSQLKEAMIQILRDLNEEDLFNMVTFESVSRANWPNMKKATTSNIELAVQQVQNLFAEGGTNVNDALIDGLKILQDSNEIGAPLIVFLTDGDPTVGVTNFKKILNNVGESNKEKIQIFSLSFGDDANFDFLKKISARNNAFARKIYADSDAALQLTGFYNEISNVLLSKISFNYLDDTVNLTSVTQTQFPSFFDGSELVVAGRLNEQDDQFNTLSLNIVGGGHSGIVELSSSTEIVSNTDSVSEFKTRLNFEKITEKTWAYLTIKKKLEEMLKTENRLLKEEVRMDALTLALKYNFVTPVTSMVVTKPEEKKQNETDSDFQDDDANALEAKPKVSAALTAPTGPQGLSGKGSHSASPGLADSDPHFIVNVKSLQYAICFDVMGNEGDVYQLITDKYSGVSVNAKVVANKQAPAGTDTNITKSHAGEIKTFLGEITIKRWQFIVSISPTKIRLMRETIDWANGTTLSHGKTKIVVDQAGSMVVVMFNDRIALLIMRHLRSKSLLRAGKVNFLGFYIVDSKGLSYHTHGLLGQFLHRNVMLKKTKNRKGKLMGRLRVSGNTQRPRKVMATLGHRLNLATNRTVSCWMVQHNGGALLDGDITDYLVKRNKPNGKIKEVSTPSTVNDEEEDVNVDE